MAGGKDNYQLLIDKLDQFIRKYYVNQLIRGSLYAVGLILLLFITVSILEYYYYFSGSVRKSLLLSFLGISGLSLSFWVFRPLLHYFNLGKVISNEKAASIIGTHFTDVKDKLLNVLQLHKQSGSSENAELILASINQKTEELKPVPFKAAINLTQNKKYLRFALPPLLLLCFLLFAAPNMITDSTTRLINNNKDFERPAPFKFSVVNKDLSVVQFEDFELNIEVHGEVMPSEVFINVDNYLYKLKEAAPGKYNYTFSNVQKETKFRFAANGFESKNYDLEVFKKPNIAGFDVSINYPGHTGRRDERVNNIGDLVVPEGSVLKWAFNAKHTDDIAVLFAGADSSAHAKRTGEELFAYSKRITKNEFYTVYVSNKQLLKADSVAYTITVVPDLYPSINAKEFRDTSESKIIYFAGDAGDDYGIRNISFNYKIDGENSSGLLKTETLLRSPGKSAQFDYTWDLLELELSPGDKISYYFEVFDNDGVNGSKSARSQTMHLELPTVEEYEQMAQVNNDDIKDNMKEAVEEAQELREEMQELKNKLLQKKELDWQDKKEMEKMLEKHENVKEKMENAKEAMKENMKNQQEFEKTNEDILEKQEKLQEMFDELLTDEMKEMIEKMEKMMEEMNRDETLEELDDMEMSDEDLEKELDRMLELFKQLELEHEMDQAIDKLEELAKEQEELSEETKKEDADQKELEKKQEELNEKFDEIQKKMDEIMEKNEELEQPMDLEDMEKSEEEIEEEMEKSSDELEKQENQKASDSQKKAAEKMKKMAGEMSAMLQSAQMQQMQEDMESLRQLLENLVNLSFDQEELMDHIKAADINGPDYVKMVQDQYKLQDDFGHIEDSLQALSKRLFQIESFVMEKVSDIRKNFDKSLTELEERKKNGASVKQQYIMTNVNDLALMLSEVMDQMQQQMASEMSGSQMCQKPGNKPGGKPGGKPMQSLGDLQQQLNQQMKDMQQKLKQGENPGKQGKPGKSGMSKEFAEMAAKQASLRKALRDLQKEQQSKGQGGGEELNELIEKMDETETELVNKRLTEQLIKRQEEILTRLLEAETAMREREYENKRKSETAQDIQRKRPPSLEEYLKKREAEVDMYKSVSPALRPYYKTLVEDYLNTIKGK